MVAFHMFFFTHWHRHWTMCPQSSAQPLRPFHRRFRWERVFRSPHGTALGFFSQPKKLPATTPCNVVSWRKYVFFIICFPNGLCAFFGCFWCLFAFLGISGSHFVSVSFVKDSPNHESVSFTIFESVQHMFVAQLHKWLPFPFRPFHVNWCNMI